MFSDLQPNPLKMKTGSHQIGNSKQPKVVENYTMLREIIDNQMKPRIIIEQSQKAKKKLIYPKK